MTNTRPVPNITSPIAQSADSKVKVFLLNPWSQWFQQFTQKAAAAVAIDLTGSPFDYTPNQNGNIYINGGTVSSASLVRGQDILDITGQKIVPTGIGDTIRITYTVAPTVKFLGT